MYREDLSPCKWPPLFCPFLWTDIKSSTVLSWEFQPHAYIQICITPLVATQQNKATFRWHLPNQNNPPPAPSPFHKTTLEGTNTKWKHVGKRDKLHRRDVATVSVYWTPSSCDVTGGPSLISTPCILAHSAGGSRSPSPRHHCQPSLPRWCANHLNSPIKGNVMFHTREKKGREESDY